MDKKVIWGNVRFTPLTAGLIRIEYAENGQFLDDDTLFSVNRAHDGSYLDIKEDGGTLTIKTDKFTLFCLEDAKKGLAAKNLYAQIHPDGEITDIWFYGKKNKGNLGGTLITLDGVRGKTPVPEGLMARDGWHVIDDSDNPVLKNDWVESRNDDHKLDLYLFVYGNDYKGALKDLAYVSGNMKMPRRCAFGSWYSRWWPYTGEEFLQIVDEYKANDFPLDILVMDMDWHYNDWTFDENEKDHPHYAKVGKGHAGNLGWTGYTWNRKLIPDPQKLLDELKKRDIIVTLNDHPADGVRAHEECYDGFRKALGHDPVLDTDPIIQASDKNYMDAFFEHAHHTLEKQGVAFWWLDWQQKYEVSGVKKLYHLPWLNYLYYLKSKTDGKRGISFSRWGGFGDHKHPIYFSGDIKSKWEALRYEIIFTARAANCGCFYWSHDTGGFFGDRNPEMYVRWVQFCITTASLRLHSQRDKLLDRCPWKWGDKEGAIMRNMFHLRSQLIPYIYSTSRQSEKESVPFIKPMYYDYPSDEKAYTFDEQYFLGDALLSSPISHPGEGEDKIAEKYVWIPEGTYYNFFTGEKVKSNSCIETYSSLDTFPLFIKGGFPLPIQPYTDRMTSKTPDTIIVKIYPSDTDCNNTFNLFDDDGITDKYLEGECLNTAITYEQKGEEIVVSVVPDGGRFEGCPKTRAFILELEQCERALNIVSADCDCKISYDEAKKLNTVKFSATDIHKAISIKLR